MRSEPNSDRGETIARSLVLGILLIAGAFVATALYLTPSKPGPCSGRVCPPSYRAFTMRVDSTTGDACVCILEAQPVASSSK
jgi:hypothetical protein